MGGGAGSACGRGVVNFVALSLQYCLSIYCKYKQPEREKINILTCNINKILITQDVEAKSAYCTNEVYCLVVCPYFCLLVKYSALKRTMKCDI